MADLPDLNPLPNNQQPSELDLTDILELTKKDLLLNLNCHAIAQIQMFNPLQQTATASVNYRRTLYKNDPLTGVRIATLVNYPFLADCPVMFLGGGNGCLTFPVTTGDDCLVFFNDRDIDNWFSGSTTSGVATNRLHSFSDGIILVGLRNLNNVIVNFNGADIELRTRDGLTKIVIAGDGTSVTVNVGPAMTLVLSADGTVSITNGVTELISALISLFQDIQTGTVNTLLGPQPLNMVQFPTHLTELETFQS